MNGLLQSGFGASSRRSRVPVVMPAPQGKRELLAQSKLGVCGGNENGHAPGQDGTRSRTYVWTDPAARDTGNVGAFATD